MARRGWRRPGAPRDPRGCLALASWPALAACAGNPAPAPPRAGAGAGRQHRRLRRRPAPSCPLPAPPPPRAAVRLAFVGDINLGTADAAGWRPARQRPGTARRRAARARRRPGGGKLRGRAGRHRHVRQVRAHARRRARRRPIARRGPTPAGPARGTPAESAADCYAFRTPTGLAPRLVRRRLHPPQPGQQPRQRLRARGPAASTERMLEASGSGSTARWAGSRSTPSAMATA